MLIFVLHAVVVKKICLTFSLLLNYLYFNRGMRKPKSIGIVLLYSVHNGPIIVYLYTHLSNRGGTLDIDIRRYFNDKTGVNIQSTQYACGLNVHQHIFMTNLV